MKFVKRRKWKKEFSIDFIKANLAWSDFFAWYRQEYSKLKEKQYDTFFGVDR